MVAMMEEEMLRTSILLTYDAKNDEKVMREVRRLGARLEKGDLLRMIWVSTERVTKEEKQ